MTWQMDPNASLKEPEYHLLIPTEELEVLAKTACGLVFLHDESLVGVGITIFSHECKFCQQVASLAYTSADDARTSLNFVKDVEIVKAALKVVQAREVGTKTLIAMLERKIRNMERHHAANSNR